MQLQNYFYWFKDAVPKNICDDIVRYAKQLQEQAKLTILEDTENWIACDKCKKWRKSDKLGAYRVTCKTMNRKCGLEVLHPDRECL